jgi:hypothetical protein
MKKLTKLQEDNWMHLTEGAHLREKLRIRTRRPSVPRCQVRRLLWRFPPTLMVVYERLLDCVAADWDGSAQRSARNACITLRDS